MFPFFSLYDFKIYLMKNTFNKKKYLNTHRLIIFHSVRLVHSIRRNLVKNLEFFFCFSINKTMLIKSAKFIAKNSIFGVYLKNSEFLKHKALYVLVRFL